MNNKIFLFKFIFLLKMFKFINIFKIFLKKFINLLLLIFKYELEGLLVQQPIIWSNGSKHHLPRSTTADLGNIYI